MRFFMSTFLIFFAIVGCGEKVDLAQAVYDEAIQLEKDGKFLAAYLMYDSLSAFPKSKIYKQAREELKNRGLSIGACLHSWTVKEMVEFENKCKRYYERYNEAAPENYFGPYYDGWGHPITVEWFPKDKIVFIIKSAGRDEKIDTEDDIFLGYREQYKFEELEGKTANRSEKKRTGQKSTAKGERIVDLGDLEDMDGISVSEQLQTIDELQAGKEKKTDEQVVDLNELLKEKKKQ